MATKGVREYKPSSGEVQYAVLNGQLSLADSGLTYADFSDAEIDVLKKKGIKNVTVVAKVADAVTGDSKDKK